MACYRDGGCGPYEMQSCSECPASKPAYRERYKANQGYSNEYDRILDSVKDWPKWKKDIANEFLLVSKHAQKIDSYDDITEPTKD